MDNKTRIEEVIEGLEYTAEFVPFSRSRNTKENPKPSDLSLNWIVKIKYNGVELVTDYMQGIGHAPSYSQGKINAQDHAKWKFEAEMGQKAKGFLQVSDLKVYGKEPIPAPNIKDVLNCLVLDSDVLERESFEDWATDFGYDPDSKTAEKIYQNCLQNALKMRHMFGDSGLEELREYFQDY